MCDRDSEVCPLSRGLLGFTRFAWLPCHSAQTDGWCTQSSEESRSLPLSPPRLNSSAHAILPDPLSVVRISLQEATAASPRPEVGTIAALCEGFYAFKNPLFVLIKKQPHALVGQGSTVCICLVANTDPVLTSIVWHSLPKQNRALLPSLTTCVALSDS